MTYQRIQGGEINLKSGIRWSRDEIIEVYHLYKKLNGVGLHEHNPEIHALAKKLGRTIRSTEAQTLMFRNLERSGDYSHGNMNKLTRDVWNEFERAKSSMSNDSIKNTHQDKKQTNQTNVKEKDSLTYLDWNELLLNYYFKVGLDDTEIGCFPVSHELFQEVTEYEFSYEDYIHSIKEKIGSEDFFTKLKKLYQVSLIRNIDESNQLARQPVYFGFLIFLINSLSEDESDDLSVSNVYKRINRYGKEIFNNKWSNINTSVARNILEPIWEDLEDWSCHFL